MTQLDEEQADHRRINANQALLIFFSSLLWFLSGHLPYWLHSDDAHAGFWNVYPVKCHRDPMTWTDFCALPEPRVLWYVNPKILKNPKP